LNESERHNRPEDERSLTGIRRRQDEPILFIDESLSPNVAKALALVAYNTITVKDVSEFQGLARVVDEVLIPWLGANHAVWIHADDNARREHGKLIVAEGIRTLWIYRPKGKMTHREQLLVLCHVLPDFLEKLRSRPKRKHYDAYIHGQPRRPRIALKEIVI
jgi:hypothetical protein